MLSERVKLARKKLGLTQQEFAARLGLTREAVACYETGQYPPSLESLEKMAQEAELPSFVFLLSTDPAKFAEQHRLFEQEARIMGYVREALERFRDDLKAKMEHENEWGPWGWGTHEWERLQGLEPVDIYAWLGSGDCQFISPNDLRKAVNYVRENQRQKAAGHLLKAWKNGMDRRKSWAENEEGDA